MVEVGQGHRGGHGVDPLTCSPLSVIRGYLAGA